MMRLLSLFLCTLWTTVASAQNIASQELLALSEDERNGVFTGILQESDQKCDRVIRTLFMGTALGLDSWEALCRNRNSYSLMFSETGAGVELVNCRELLATSKMLLHKAGSKTKATGCRIK